MDSVGSLLRAGRLGRGMTQAQVSAASGVPQRTISEWESGCHDPPFLGLCKVARAIEISVLDLVPRQNTGGECVKPRRGRPSAQEIAKAARGQNGKAVKPR